jgi:perosamine synthetase
MRTIPLTQPTIVDAERKELYDVLETNWLTFGPKCREFEKRLAKFLDCSFVVVTGSGTSALHLALVACEIGPGDEVLVPDLTYVATANAVSYCGAKPVLCDVDPVTWNIDLEDARKKITPRTTAIIPVHLYGNPCDMGKMIDFAVETKVKIIEDAAEGFGGTYAGLSLGTFGPAGSFSFYGNKVVTTGEGGAVATNSSYVKERLEFYRGQAQSKTRYFHSDIGFNYRMTEMQAAIGIGQMTHVNEMLAARRSIFSAYQQKLAGKITVQEIPSKGVLAPWLFTAMFNGVPREVLKARLDGAGVETRPAFCPLHRMPMYKGNDEDFPVASRIGDTAICLPTYPNLLWSDARYICEEIIGAIKEHDESRQAV